LYAALKADYKEWGLGVMIFKYAGFISYAHADEAIAARLHHALETYAIPKSLKPKESRAKLSPIFRDTTELTAHHSLSEKIREAVQSSRFLIVLCSPAAKASHWVNEEIRLFRSLHGEGAILCVLAEGTPETSFPTALLEEGREPLAANLGESKESFRLGTTQLAASMLGVGLDVLIQRESKRRRRRLQLITASALVFSGLMGATTLTAIDARNDAQDSRSQAEGLVEYMITDLKDKLEPLGKLDILDSVGDEAVKYYDTQNIDGLSDESLTRQAKARHILGQVALTEGDEEKARKEIEAAAALTAEVLKRNQEDSAAIFAHAQSEYWVGAIYAQFEPERAMRNWIEYAELGKKLYELDSSKFDWVMERAWGVNNIALLHARLKDYESAQQHYLKAVNYFEAALDISPDSVVAKKELANAVLGVSNTALEIGNLELAKTNRERQLALLSDLIQNHPRDINLEYRHFRAKIKLYRLEAKITPSVCSLRRTKKNLENYHKFLNHDKKNHTWHIDYIANWYNLLKICPTIYSQAEYKTQIELLLSEALQVLKEKELAEWRAKIMSLK